ncbi:peptidase S41 [Polaribacter pectinis]|uniref:Peptidase S41 n=1 Tax=Polaribacter pectinis TaxID=2738844 RepID=A0A7G9LCR2_9FLAO|nr:S41 family peptidase [Polaribacter pectinis]QNM86411.1 peptidase S41 [Polaribacter pectinis]
MKKIIQLSILTFLLLIASCTKSDSEDVIEPVVNDDINYFIWNGMNAYYLWQKDVPDLADNRFATFSELYTYFRGYSSPENVFESLLNRPADRFSWIVDDYIELENSFQGINVSNGMEFGLKRYNNSAVNIYGYVRYVIPNSDAAAKGIKRGMLFNAVNGTQLTDSNYTSLLFGNSTNYTAEFADYNNGNPISNGTSVNLNKTQLQENPVAISKVITDGNKKIGYLLYNQFASTYDRQLNAAFANFKAANVDELIIDLRYNGGGSVRTSTYLGGMITGQFNGQLYSKEIWNEKVQDAVSADRFLNNFTDEIKNTDQNGNVVVQENINSLNLNSVYFIVSGSTASASELVINALSAYIDVKLVGTKTVGKQVGSITLYDSEDLQRDGNNLNPDHRYAMQPIVLEISNKNGQNNPNGYTPGSVTSPGIALAEDYGNLGVLGERSDPLLDRTLTYISTGSKGNFSQKSVEYSEIYNSKLATPASNNMYVKVLKK